MPSEELAEQTKSIFIDFVQMKSFAEKPLILADGEDIYVTDVDGNRYIDGLSGVMVCNLGYGNKRIIEAVSEQLKRLQLSMPMYATNEMSLRTGAAKLRDRLRDGGGGVRKGRGPGHGGGDNRGADNRVGRRVRGCAGRVLSDPARYLRSL